MEFDTEDQVLFLIRTKCERMVSLRFCEIIRTLHMLIISICHLFLKFNIQGEGSLKSLIFCGKMTNSLQKTYKIFWNNSLHYSLFQKYFRQNFANSIANRLKLQICKNLWASTHFNGSYIWIRKTEYVHQVFRMISILQD